MSQVRCACPSCQMPLQFPQPAAPVQIQCPRCQTTFVVGAPQPAQAPASAAPILRAPRKPATSKKPLLFVGIALGVVVIGVVLILVLRGGKPEETGGLGGTGEDALRGRVNDAIARGVAYLKQQMHASGNDYYFNDPGGGSQLGVQALAALTLLECGVSSNDESVQLAVKQIRAAAPRLRYTYSLALAVLFLDRWHEARDLAAGKEERELIRRIATQLISYQNSLGGWDYYCDPISDAEHRAVLAALESGKEVPARADVSDKDDNSINQFVTLALWAARKHGVKTDAVLKKIEERYRKNQNANGSWGYRAKDDRYLKDATTCAGLIGLAVGRGVDADAAKAAKKDAPGDPRKDPAVAKALEYVGGSLRRLGPKNVTAKDKAAREEHTRLVMGLYKAWHESTEEARPRLAAQINDLDRAPMLKGIYVGADSWGDLYFLWSLERMAVIFDLKKIDNRDWYAWGAEVILANQLPDGSWRDRFPGVPDTCFALLFLKRANVAKDLTDKLRTVPRGAALVAPPVPGPGPALPARRRRRYGC